MSAWVRLLLLLLLLAARPRVTVRAEVEALPAALVELVRNSPISSIEDLQLLLLSDSVDEEEEEEEEAAAVSGTHRLPRSLEAQPAQQALCKVRTEVVEVTRAMLDRTNANFMLWPPCVEVQRCSGCCNAKSMQCVPYVTHTRYLQVMRIEYVNKRPTYSKAVVSVLDHVECRCQTAPRAPAPRRKSTRQRQHNNNNHHPHHNQTQEHGQVKAQSKDELHQWDELKQNQRVQLEELLEQHWSPRGDTFTQPGEPGYSLDPNRPPAGDALLLAPHWTHNSSRFDGTEGGSENLENLEKPGHNQTVSSVDKLNQTDGKGHEGSPILLSPEDKSRFIKHHRGGGASQPVTENPQGPTQSERHGNRLRPTKEPNPEPRELARRRENETPEEEVRISKMEEAKLEEERKELLLLHKRLDQEKEILRQQQMKREEEEKESRQQDKRQHHPHTTTTQQPATTTTTTTTRQPVTPAAPRPPARPKQARRRMRKNRKRISKAAMRAMLM